MIEIYFKDLTEEKQKEIIEALGDNGNYDVFPIATVFENDVVILERYDLLDFHKFTGDIKVDKCIFDDFVEGSFINIHFTEDDDNVCYTYKMTDEDDEGIWMERIDG